MRDYSLPGYKYLGPGNKLNKGKPRNKNDYVAYTHDIEYDKYIKGGRNPYTNYNKADEAAYNDFTWDDYGGALGKTFFAGKRLASKAGFIGDLETPPAKRLRGSRIKPVVKELAKAKDLSLNNLRTQVNMSSGNGGLGSGNLGQGALKETPVDDQPRYLECGPEDYTFAKLPYYAIKNVAIPQIYSADLAFRMTSPYDPEVFVSSNTLSGTAAPVITPNLSDPDGGVNNKANWFEFYAGMYKYYHVTECRWSMYIENTGGEPLYIHQMYYNDELPPQGATNTDIMGWPYVNTKILQPQFKAIDSGGYIQTNEINRGANMTSTVDEDDTDTGPTSNYSTGNNISSRIGRSSCSFSGKYSPGQFRREVNLDSQVENWTQVSTNPSLPERLLFRFKPENPALNAVNLRGDQVAFKAFFKCEYVVEFKELVAGLRWPVQRQPMLVTVQTNSLSTTA